MKASTQRSVAALAAFVLVMIGGCVSETAQRTVSAEIVPDGGQIYKMRCAMCHTLRDPKRYDFATLDRALDKYAWRAGCNNSEKAGIRDYLRANAADGN
ncbi:MAG: hypothetical protein HY286_18980 [Planctomycetes bacterium]|nr:hypothetical protein [Planctomycetota bacterium]